MTKQGSAFSAARWVLFGNFGVRMLALLGQLAILRLVSKEVFGAYGALITIPMMLIPFLPFGFDQLLIREKSIKKRYIIALSWSLFLLGGLVIGLTALLTLAMGVGIQGISDYIPDQLDTFSLLMLMGVLISFTIKLSIRSTLAAVLNFKKIAQGELLNNSITYIGGALLVFIFPSINTLLLAFFFGELIDCYWLYRNKPFRMVDVLLPKRIGVFRKLFRKHRKFCLVNTSDLTLNTVGNMIPVPLIAILISEEATAELKAAQMIIIVPIALVTGSLWRVVFPSLSGLKESELISRCLRIIGTTAAFLPPAVIWLTFFAPITASIILGEKYISSAHLVPWLAVFVFLQGIYNPISSLDVIRDRPEVGLYWNVVHTLARILVIFLCAPKGLYFTIVVMSLTSGFLWVIWAYMLGSLLQSGMIRYSLTVLKFLPLWVLLASGYFLTWSLYEEQGYITLLMASSIPSLIYLYLLMRFYPIESSMLLKFLNRNQI